ncbi:auxilin-like protein SWA2 [Rhodotorula paludigena]|uniref:auxilin-like protein SWA2 n=1 Tax=Rhodotorula paludigena TaxID=86838 RepID=UPI0031779F1F
MDDLFDLDFASAKPAASVQIGAQAKYGGGRSAFDYLAGASAAQYAPSQPARTPTPQQARAPTPRTQQSGGDAFSSLFGTSAASSPGAAQGAGLSMAERLQRESAAKIGGYAGLGAIGGGNGSLGAFPAQGGGAGSRTQSPALQPAQRVASPASSLLSPTSRTSSPAVPAQPASAVKGSDVWDFDMLSSSVPKKTASPAPPAAVPAAADDPFDLGFNSFPVTASTSTAPQTAPAQADDFDLLDAFSAPAASRPPPAPKPAAASHSATTGAPAPAASARSSTASPSVPPHILGQLVEMGYSPSRASAALEATRSPTGDYDVSLALDALADEQRLEEARRRKQREQDEWGDEDDVKVGRRRSWELDDDDDRGAREAREREMRRRQAAQQQREEAGAATQDGRRGSPAAGSDAAGGSSRARGPAAAQDPAAVAREQAKVLQEQAGEYLAQAQKIGFSMFKSANAYWGEGKKALAKAIEEQRAAAKGAPSTAGAGAASGKPKWWSEGMNEDGAPGGSAAPPPSGFKDSDDEAEGPEPATRARPAPQTRARQVQSAEPSTSEYRSPFRRAKPKPAAADVAPSPSAVAEADLLYGAPAPAPPRPSASPAPASAARARATPSPTPRRPPVSTRPHVAVPSSALAAAQKHKTLGNEHFKLGRFGEATAAYTLALESLPEQWLGRVPLLNNRAQARLRSGEEKSAAEDCTEAVGILGLNADLAALEAESQALPSEVGALYAGGAPVDLRDQLGKALGRRAKANEANEKWAAARDDWEKVLKLGDDVVTRGAGGAKMVSDGVARCRKVLDPPSAVPSPSARSGTPARPVSRAKARSPAPPVEGSGDAVRALQAQQAASAAEDDLRHQLKDQVDARIAAWKGGKETNLRALIASLDSVLWPELGWKTVGMHELIADNALKVRYVRAIAKVHPDKLNTTNTTVEQRMIAALVFAALNDAWNGMK